MIENVHSERSDDVQNVPEKNDSYQEYRDLGGIINKEDYQSVLLRAKNPAALGAALIEQSELIARGAGIELHNTKEAIDPRTLLYGILRTDSKPQEAKYHHSQMSDQRLFAEALRMLEDTDALRKLIDAYPNIPF